MPTRRIWFDLLTPKQVLFYAPIIQELESSGAEVLVTSRRYREVGPLAQRAGLHLRFVGTRGDRGRESQLLAATERQSALIPIVKGFGPQVAVSTASAVCARISFGLGIKHLAVNDSPHSEVACRLSIPLSHHLLCPWVIPYEAWRKYGIGRDQVSTYRALDPAAWLKRPPLRGPVPRLSSKKMTITVRVQESDAPYMAGTRGDWVDSLLAAIERGFPETNLVALCRYDYQVDEVKKRYGSRYIVPRGVVGGHDLLAATDVFIGMGGTMSAEAALMGVPTISAFQGDLYTDRYLESTGLLIRSLRPGAIVARVKEFLDSSFKSGYAKKARTILDSMEDPVPRVAAFINKTSEQG